MQHIKTDISSALEALESSDEFKAFDASNPHHYLVHCFASLPGNRLPDKVSSALEFGYYSKETDKITVFKAEPLVVMPAEEIFKEEGALESLDISALRLGLADALSAAERFRAESYPRHEPMQVICILQQHTMHGKPIWNITMMTNTLNMLNLKIDATNGELLSRELHSVMTLVKE